MKLLYITVTLLHSVSTFGSNQTGVLTILQVSWTFYGQHEPWQFELFISYSMFSLRFLRPKSMTLLLQRKIWHKGMYFSYFYDT